MTHESKDRVILHSSLFALLRPPPSFPAPVWSMSVPFRFIGWERKLVSPRSYSSSKAQQNGNQKGKACLGSDFVFWVNYGCGRTCWSVYQFSRFFSKSIDGVFFALPTDQRSLFRQRRVKTEGSTCAIIRECPRFKVPVFPGENVVTHNFLFLESVPRFRLKQANLSSPYEKKIAFLFIIKL